MDKGTRRFSQTAMTPLMNQEFIDQVGYQAELPGSEEILQGTFQIPPDMDPYAAQFITQLKMNDEVQGQTISKAILTASYREG